MHSFETEVIEFVLAQLGLPYAPCGLNADWCVNAFHVGPSKSPNRVSGDLYILDTEDMPGEFVLVRRVFTEDGTNEITDLSPRGESLIAVARRAKAALESNPPNCAHCLHSFWDHGTEGAGACIANANELNPCGCKAHRSPKPKVCGVRGCDASATRSDPFGGLDMCEAHGEATWREYRAIGK